MSEKSELKPWPVDPETGEPATQECSHCGAKAGPTWTSWQCCRYPFGSCDGVMKPLTRPEPEPGDRERAEALAERIYALRGENFILGAHKGGDCYRETCDCIANDLAALLAQVRAEERERCAKVAESLYGKTYWDDPVAGIAAAIRRGGAVKPKTVLLPCDINDPATGLPLYVEAEIRSIWYWRWRRVCLFCGIVWRDFHGARIGIKTAWQVSEVAYGLTEEP